MGVLLTSVIAQAPTVRWYVTTIIGTGTEEDPFRPAIDDAQPNGGWAALIPSLPSGVPAFAFALVYVRSSNWAAVDADARNIRLFRGEEGDTHETLGSLLTALDATRWGQLSGPTRQATRQTLAGLGIPTADITAATSLRAILQKVGRHLTLVFDETKVFVGP